MTFKHHPLQKEGHRIITPKENPVNFNAKKPKISFEFLEGDYCLSKCEVREKAEIADSLHRLSKHTWQELLTLGRKHGGCEPLPLSELKCAVPDNILFREQKPRRYSTIQAKFPSWDFALKMSCIYSALTELIPLIIMAHKNQRLFSINNS